MRLRHFPLAAAVFYVGLNIHVAPAQSPSSPAPPMQVLQNDKAKPAQAGTEEPSVKPPAKAATEVFVNGQLAVPGAPSYSQTVPSKFSERNAKLDKLPTMALPLGLTDEQKRDIAQTVAQGDAPVSDISAKPADMLPADTPVTAFSDKVKDAAPMTSGLHFIRTRDKILFVRANTMVVVGEISTN
jgi:hypothetical protein